jgi:hypothetical protein
MSRRIARGRVPKNTHGYLPGAGRQGGQAGYLATRHPCSLPGRKGTPVYRGVPRSSDDLSGLAGYAAAL